MAPYPAWPLEESRAGTGLRWLGGHGRAQPVPDEPVEASERCEPALHAPQRWGLSAEAVAHLGDCLFQFWLRFRSCFTTHTRDTSTHAYDYLRAQLTMDTARNFANMDRTLHGGDGQALQPTFKGSESPCRIFGLRVLYTTRRRGPAHHRPTDGKVGPQRAARPLDHLSVTGPGLLG